jgi:hypothetical protein
VPPSQLSVPDDLVFTSNGQDMLALKGTATPPAAIVHAPTGAVTDGDLSPNTLAPSIDETNHALNIRVEYSDTTLKTAVIPFQVSTVTVGATGADFTTIQAAWNFLKGRAFSSNVTISVQSGTYAEQVFLQDQPYSGLVLIIGDTRTAAGQHFPTTGSITKSGSNCTITLTATPPADFTSADHVVIGGANNVANVGRFPIVSIDTVNKTVTYTNASGVAEAVRPNTELIFCPDRIVDFSGFSSGVVSTCFEAPVFSGFTMLSSTASTAITASDGCLTVTKIAAYNIQDLAFQARVGGILRTDANCSAVKCTYGFHAVLNGTIHAPGTYAANGTNGFYATVTGTLFAQSSVAAKCVNGFLADGGMIYAAPAVAADNTVGFHAASFGHLAAATATARSNGTGYVATWNSLLAADLTNANNSGNTANYNPGTSGTPSSNNGLIRWS